jgi:hypothetical protein
MPDRLCFRAHLNDRMARRVAAAILVLLAAPSHAIESIALEIGDLRAAFGTAEGVVVILDFGGGGAPAVSVRAAAVALPPPVGRISELRVDCPALQTADNRLVCERASASAVFAQLGAQSFHARFAYDVARGNIELHAEGLELARAPVEVELSGTAEDWRLELGGHDLDAGALATLAAGLGMLEAAPELAGTLDIAVTARGGGSGPVLASARLAGRDLSGSDADGRLAAESLALELTLELVKTDGAGWDFEAAGAVASGQLYVEPWFLEPEDAPLELQARGTLDDGALHVREAAYQQAGVVHASGEARLELEPGLRVESARVQIDDARFPAAYRIYLQPWLYGGDFDALATSGRAEARFVIEDGALTGTALRLHDLHIDDAKGRVAIYGLDGELHWRVGGAATDSRLRWDGGFVYGLGYGAAAAAVSLHDQGFRLLGPLVVPLLDGSLHIAELAVDSAPELAVRFDAELAPIDMRALTAALGWPSFAGQLSGRIPELSYDEGLLTLGGDIRAEVFGGTVTVENLRLRDPLGDLPRLEANVRVRGLDLDTLTDTFEIGRIEGRLDGDIDGLRLFRWSPVAFDANFHTPRDDDSRQRISQRAVESIASLGGGGGAAAVLSSGFLRFFESFAYARIGLGCRLENGVCHMHGVAPAPQGYYIVQGKWLPRIDVIGYADRVDWPVLVEQLHSLTQVDEAVVR